MTEPTYMMDAYGEIYLSKFVEKTFIAIFVLERDAEFNMEGHTPYCAKDSKDALKYLQKLEKEGTFRNYQVIVKEITVLQESA